MYKQKVGIVFGKRGQLGEWIYGHNSVLFEEVLLLNK